MSEQQFWCTTPRKLSVLAKVHRAIHNPQKSNNVVGYIDNVL